MKNIFTLTLLILVSTNGLASTDSVTCSFGSDRRALLVFEYDTDTIKVVDGHYNGLGSFFPLSAFTIERILFEGSRVAEFRVGSQEQHVDAPFRLRLFESGAAALYADAYYIMDFGGKCSFESEGIRSLLFR